MCKRASAEDKELLILGDLNCNYKIDESLGNNPVHYMESLFLPTQMVEKQTRVIITSSSLINVIP